MHTQPIAIGIAGAGRMGRAVADSVEQHPNFELAGIWQRGDDLNAIVAKSDVVIDFSLPAATDSVIAAVIRNSKPLVCGVSGLSEAQLGALSKAGQQVAVVYDRNMSLGIAVLERSIREAAQSLGPEFEIAISEVHHVHKKDAPSGTALKLGEAVNSVRSGSGASDVRFSVERRGEVPGDHEVSMRSGTEILTFSHSVTTRQVFVDGALRAAQWIVGKPSGGYSMQDVLFSHLK